LATSRFCDECGTALTATRTANPTPEPVAARKKVTALFADLVGSTAFAERLDPEAVRAGLAPYFALLQSTIDDHAGTVVKFLGDGMFALFGVPEVAEDDALRAVTAAVELQRRFESFADGVRDRHGVELGLRIGINTGELVIGTDDVDLVGDVLNTAARLEATCAPGQVLVGEDTWRLTRSSVSYEVLGEVRVKGKAEPIATFQVTDHDVGIADELTPFVGRAGEVDVLRALLDDATASSAARLATVIGDPGVGKTRLAHEVRAASAARSFDLRLERRGSTTFAPIADLLREVTGSGSIEEVDRLIGGDSEAARLGPVLASFLGHGEPRSTEESFWAVRRLLERLASDVPLIVVVDDIQWAEPLFWDLLDHLVEWTAAPVLLIALARPELRELRPELTQPGRRVSAAIALEGLDPDTTLELAARLLGIGELPPELAERLPRSTDGNPLFVRELVQMLVEDGVLERDGDRWRLTIDADAIEVPPTILSLLASRVERLPDDERQVVELASVIGTEFDRGALTAIAAGDVAARLGATLDRLRRKDLVEPTGQWAGDHPVYRFHHVLIRDAAYRRLLKGHRAELHERVGHHVDTTGIADDERDVIVAHHFEQVYQYRSELGSIDDPTRKLAVEAATRLRSAAEQALGREDLASAGNAALRALRLLDTEAGAQRDDLLLIGCEALLSSADVARGGPLVDELHTRSADTRLAAWADCFRAQLWSLTAADRLTEADQVAADAAELLASIGDHAGVAKARLVRAGCLARLGRVGDCETELDLALSAARAAGDRRRTVAVLGAAPLAALWGPSPIARAGGRCLDVLRLLRITTASPTVEATSIRCQGMLEALRGRHEAALAKFETSRSMAQELGLRHALYETELFAGLAELLTGDAIAAEPHLRAAHEGLGRLGIGADAGQAAALLARSLLLQGRDAEADVLATVALDTAGQNLQTAIAARAVLAEVRAAQGKNEEAQMLVGQALSIVAPTDVILDHALTLLAAARVATAAGNHLEATRRRTLADELLASKGVSVRFGPTLDSAPADPQPPTAPAGPEPQRPRIWNRALEIGRRATESATARDRDRFMACFAAGFTTIDHGGAAAAADFGGRVGAESWTDFAMWLMEQNEGSFGEATSIARRGDRHALMRWTLRSPTTSLERLLVLASDGVVLLSAHFFDPDQIFDAIDELDRQWEAEDPSAIPRQSQSPGKRLTEATASGDADAIRAALTDDFVALDHRQVGLGERHVDAWVESMTATTGPTFVTIPVDILMGGGHHTLTQLAVSVGDDTWHVLTITAFRDDRVARIEHFDCDDIQAATDRYQQLARGDDGGRRLTNTAWEIGLVADDAYRRRDGAELLQVLSPAFVGNWHQRLAEDGLVEVTRDVFVETVLSVGDTDMIDRTTELMAIRGDRLALVRATTVFEAAREVRYVVLESDDTQLTRSEHFDADQLADALDVLDRRFLLSQGLAPEHWVVRGWHGTYATGADAITPHLHPDVEFAEHRRFIERSGGASTLLDAAGANAAGTAMVPQVFRVTEHGAVYERVEAEPGAPGELRMVMVLGFADDSVRHVETFGPDSLDAALARYDEIVRSQTRPTGGAAPNHAYRIAEELARATVRRDRDAMLALLADDFTSVAKNAFREALGLSTPLTRMETVDDLLAAYQDGQVGSRTRAILATRGNHLYLSTSTLVSVGGDELVIAVVGESDDTRLRRLTYFDESQVQQAVDELDRRYRLECGIDDDHWIARNWVALTSVDADQYDGILSPDFQSFDHRAFTLGLTGRAEFLAYIRATPASSTWSVPVIHRLNDRAMVLEHAETWADGSGEGNMLVVVEYGDGSTARVDTYDVNDLDAALARYDDITGKSRREFTNNAWQAAQQLQGAQFSDGSESPDFELIAIRGDDLCLYRVGMLDAGGDLTERLVVFGASDGLCTRMDLFAPDRLADAFAHLDRFYRLACGIGDDHWITTHWWAIYSADFAELQPVLHPEFEFVERRRLAWPNGGVDDWSEWLTPDSAPIGVTIRALYRLSDHGVVTLRSERFDTGERGVSESVLVNEVEDGSVRRVLSYAPEDLDLALAEFDAFVIARSGRTHTGHAGGFTNSAWELVQRVDAMRQDGDRDGYASLLVDDVVVVTYDPIMAAIDDDRGAYDKEQYLDALFDPTAFGPTGSSELDLIAVRGDRFCLFRVCTSTVEGDVHERIVVVEVHDGRAVLLQFFPHDQLRTAQVALDRRWFASLGLDERDWIVRRWDLAYVVAFDQVDGSLHRDFEIVDRRPLHFPRGDAATLAETWGTLSHEIEVLIPRIHRVSRSGAVHERIERAVGDVLGEVHMIMVTHIVDDAIRRTELFDVGDLPAALARYEEVMSTVHKLTNRAWTIAQDAQRAQAGGDRARFASFFADDFVVTTHDSIMAQVTHGIYDKALWLEAALDPLLFGPTSSYHLELIAVRGDDRCLFRSRATTQSGDTHERLSVLEASDGLAVRMDVFPHDQIRPAQITLDRRWLASLGFTEDDPWFELVGLFYDADSTVIARALSEHFEYVDHRRLSFPNGDRTQILINANTLIEDVEVVIPRYVKLTDRLAIGERIEQTVDGAAMNGGLHVTALGAAGLIEHMEIFEVDDEAAALACFDRLLTEERREAVGLGPLTNAAWDVVCTERTLGDANGEHELIAIRSDRFCLTRFISAGHERGAIEQLVVSEAEDGRVRRSIQFAADDLVAALIELDAWYSSEIDEPEFHAWVVRMAAAFDHGTIDDLRALVTDDFDSVDERRLGLGRRTADEWATSLVPLVGHHQPVTTRVIRHEGPIWLNEVRPHFALDGSEWQMLVLVARDGHRIRCWHVFDVEQAELALARYEELTSALRPSLVPPLTNRAWEITTAFNDAYVTGDRDATDHLVDPDGQVEYRRRLSVATSSTARSFLDVVLASHAEANDNRQQLDLVAVRGEHLCLVLVDGWYDDANLRSCLLVETDEQRVTHMVWFDDDQLREAQLELDRRWMASIGYADHWFETIRLTLYDPHPDAMFDYLAPDFQYIDHRPLMFPSGDAELMRSTIASLQHDVVFTVPRIHRISDAGWAFERIETAVGEIGRHHIVFVTHCADQLVQSIEAFDITQLDQALARYDKFTTD
jgi:class 3 adenylate cyclase